MGFWGTLGSIAGSVLPGVGQHMANVATRKLAREQMRFQERMSSTAWQRAVGDMKRAGINPLLAFQQGGASSPGGAMARMENVLAPSVSSAVQLQQVKKQLQLVDAQIAEREGNVKLKAQQAAYYGAKAINEGFHDLMAQDGGPIPWKALSERERMYLTRAQRGLARANTDLSRAGLPAAKVMGSNMAAYINMISRALPSFGVGALLGRGRKGGGLTIQNYMDAAGKRWKAVK